MSAIWNRLRKTTGLKAGSVGLKGRFSAGLSTALGLLAQRFSALRPRERRIMIVAAVLLALLLFIGYGWLPLMQSRTQLAAQIPQLQAALASMQQDAAEIKRITSLPPMTAKRNGLNEAALRQAWPKAQLTRMQNQEGWQLYAEGINYAQWLDQLQALQAVTGAQVVSFDVRQQGGRLVADWVVRP